MAFARDVTGWTEQEVLDLMASAKTALNSGGQIGSWSSSGSSVSRVIDASATETLQWCQWALKELNPEVWGFNRTRTVGHFSGGPYAAGVTTAEE